MDRVSAISSSFFAKAVALTTCIVCLATTPPPARAQGAATATPTKPSGKLMTRDELRACMKTEATLKERAQTIEAERKSTDDERVSIVKHRDELKADAETLDRANVDAVAAYNDKIRVLDSRIDAWNPKNAALVEKTKAYQSMRDDWKSQCASRRYNEDDEKAIRAGK